MGGIAKLPGLKALAIGGADDHVHLLLSMPATVSIADAIRKIKAGSSKWLHDEIGQSKFAWQEGYGAFSIGKSQVNDTVAYIMNQAQHHRKFDFKAEFIAFLTKHEIEYDPRYVWG
jgi:REP element-mobilizing transposase RayT